MESRLQVEVSRELLQNVCHILAFHDLLTVRFAFYSGAPLAALVDILGRSAQYLFHHAQS